MSQGRPQQQPYKIAALRDAHHLAQWLAAGGAPCRKMIDRQVGCRHLTQGFHRMTQLAAGLLVRRTTQTTVPWRLLQSVTRRRLATVTAVQPKTTGGRVPSGRVLGASATEPIPSQGLRGCLRPRSRGPVPGSATSTRPNLQEIRAACGHP
jgi:hypothetical protein